MFLEVLTVKQGQCKQHYIIKPLDSKSTLATVVADELTTTATGKPVFVVKSQPYQINLDGLAYTIRNY